MFNIRLIIIASLLLLLNFNSSAQPYETINLSHLHSSPIGASIFYFQEDGSKLTANQAFQLFHQKGISSGVDISRSNHKVISFDMGSKPVWLLVPLVNKSPKNITRHVEIDDSWLDKLDFYFFHNKKLNQFHNLGDSLPFKQRNNNNRLFNVTHHFPPSTTQLLIRVETEDSIILPIYILNDKQLNDRIDIMLTVMEYCMAQ